MNQITKHSTRTQGSARRHRQSLETNKAKKNLDEMKAAYQRARDSANRIAFRGSVPGM